MPASRLGDKRLLVYALVAVLPHLAQILALTAASSNGHKSRHLALAANADHNFYWGAGGGGGGTHARKNASSADVHYRHQRSRAARHSNGNAIPIRDGQMLDTRE